MLLTVVLDREHQFGPTHLEVVAQLAVGAHQWDLRLRSRKALAHEEQPQPGFAWRRRTGVIQIQDGLQLTKSANASMTSGDGKDPVCPQSGCITQCIQAGHSVTETAPTRDVESRSRDRRHPHPGETVVLVAPEKRHLS